MGMKLLRKISIGGINGVRGGLKDVKGRVRVMTIAGIVSNYKEKTSETMGVSFAFNGEFKAINQAGEECAAPVAYLPEPAQGLLKAQIDAIEKDNPGSASVEFAFNFYAVEDETAIKGYAFECEPLLEARASTALETLTAQIGMVSESKPAQPALGHDGTDADHAETAHAGKGKGKGK